MILITKTSVCVCVCVFAHNCASVCMCVCAVASLQRPPGPETADLHAFICPVHSASEQNYNMRRPALIRPETSHMFLYASWLPITKYSTLSCPRIRVRAVKRQGMYTKCNSVVRIQSNCRPTGREMTSLRGVLLHSCDSQTREGGGSLGCSMPSTYLPRNCSRRIVSKGGWSCFFLHGIFFPEAVVVMTEAKGLYKSTPLPYRLNRWSKSASSVASCVRGPRGF